MSLLEHYREWYEYEKDCNLKMLAMIESVPEDNRSDARFQRAVTLAGHLAACRENWLKYILLKNDNPVQWFDESCDPTTLRSRFAALESQWTDFLAHLDEEKLAQDFEFAIPDEGRFRLPTEVQIVQLIGHAHYHRGQVSLLTDQLAGETVDTDYADWWWAKQHRNS